MTDGDFERLLRQRGFGHLATIGPSGKPQSHPVWYSWDGRHLEISQTDQTQKLQNMRVSPDVSLSIMDPDDPYTYVEVRGEVVAIEEDRDRRFIDSLAQAYLGKEKYPWDPPDAKRFVVRIRPRRLRGQP